MSSEWPQKRLGDCCEKIGSGATPKGGKDAYLEFGPVYLIRSQNIHSDGFSPSGLAFISEEQAQKLDSVKVESGDVLLNITGDSVARVCQALNHFLPARVNQHVAIIRPKSSEFDSRFLRYFLASPVQQDFMLGLAAAGATRNALTKGMIESFQVPCPPLPVQQGIADVLAELDDRITLLRETNATLEAIAQALFKSWFVDFDPVRAKMEGRVPEGMDEATAALFLDAFEESVLGAVPRGWRASTVGNEIQTVDYVANGSFAALKENVTLRSVPSFALYLRTTDYNSGFKSDFRFVDKSAYEFLSKSCLDGSEVVISNVGDVGTVFRPPKWLGFPMTLGSNAVALKNPKMSSFMFYYFKADKGQNALQSIVTGSAQLKFNKTNLRSLSFLVPSIGVTEKFEQIASTLLAKQDSNNAHVQTLSSLRGSLLPRLLSGQLRLTEASSILAEARPN